MDGKSLLNEEMAETTMGDHHGALRSAYDEIKHLRQKIEELKHEIGAPIGAHHPLEQKPRGKTWHYERLNWLSEVNALRSRITELEHKEFFYSALERELDILIEIARAAKQVVFAHMSPDKAGEECIILQNALEKWEDPAANLLYGAIESGSVDCPVCKGTASPLNVCDRCGITGKLYGD